MHRPLALLAATLLFAAPAAGQIRHHDAGAAMVQSLAAAMDANSDGAISLEELTETSALIFEKIDADSSGSLTFEEMTDWEFGLAEMAEFRGRGQAYDAAMGVVFDMFDRDNSGQVDGTEHSEAITRAAQYADTDNDGAMSFDEFYSNFIVNVALRNAMIE
ncbi:MAG: EF-hand domain-containing protein [Pseudomonadota bacterium]